MAVESPWVQAISADAVALTSAQVMRSGGHVVRLDGSRMRTLESLYREYAREWNFPEYFGWNWPAFSECLRDLSWIPAHAYLTEIWNSDDMLVDESDERPTLIRQLSRIGDRWANAVGLGPEWGNDQVTFKTLLIPSRAAS